MQAQFTQQTRRAVADAYQEASESGSPCVEPEHLLVSVLRGDHSEASIALRKNGHAPEAIYAEVCALLDAPMIQKERATPLTPSTVVLSARAEATLSAAARIAAQLGRHYMGTDHVLAALIAEPTDALAAVWKRHGIAAELALFADRDTPRPAPKTTMPRQIHHHQPAWSQYTFAAKQAIGYATAETTQSGYNQLLPPFLLAGVLHESDTVAARALRHLGTERNGLRESLADLIETGAGYDDTRQVTFGKSASDALKEARRVAATLGDPHIGTEHLLLGILAGQGETADLLRSRGVATANFLTALRSVKRGRRAERKRSEMSRADFVWVVLFLTGAVIAAFIAYLIAMRG